MALLGEMGDTAPGIADLRFLATNFRDLAKAWRDFRYDALTQRSSIERLSFDGLDAHDTFVPDKTYPPMTVAEIGR